MNAKDAIVTGRLLLRRWRESDREPFAAMNRDPRVMEFFPAILSREESDARINRAEKHFQDHGFGPWAVELPGVADFIGFLGLSIPQFEMRFTPCVEIGWRIAAPYWNFGYATEGARASLEHGFLNLGLAEIVSFTATSNARSRRVMEKLGMSHALAEDFDHPLLPPDHQLTRHVLYRLRRDDWFGLPKAIRYDRM